MIYVYFFIKSVVTVWKFCEIWIFFMRIAFQMGQILWDLIAQWWDMACMQKSKLLANDFALDPCSCCRSSLGKVIQSKTLHYWTHPRWLPYCFDWKRIYGILLFLTLHWLRWFSAGRSLLYNRWGRIVTGSKDPCMFNSFAATGDNNRLLQTA